MTKIRTVLETFGETDAFVVSEEMLPLLYDELRSLATGYMARQSGCQTLQATALVHEAWLRLAGEDFHTWDKVHFFNAAAQAMRHILVDRARAKASFKRGANAERVDIDGLDLADADVDERVLLVDEMLKVLERENPRLAEIVSLKFFGGMVEKDIAAVQGSTQRTVSRQWSYAKARLFELIQTELRPRSS